MEGGREIERGRERDRERDKMRERDGDREHIVPCVLFEQLNFGPTHYVFSI